MLFIIVYFWSDKSDFLIWSLLKDFYRDMLDLIVFCVIRILCFVGLVYVGSFLVMSEVVVKEELKFKLKLKRDDYLKGLV